MPPVRRWVVTAGGSEAGIRLDRYLAGQIPEESRSRIQDWIRSGHVEVNGAATKTGHRVRHGDAITLHEPDRPEPLPAPEPIPLEILYRDDDIAVVDKPPGLVTHVGAGVRAGTLVNALLHHLGPIAGGEPTRPGIVHRLDKNTSGLLVVARNPVAHRRLAAQFRNREVGKEYLALVYGHPTPAGGTIDVPIGRDPKQRRKISVRAVRSRRAVTHYRVLRPVGPFALTSVRIETGRTHQIRVHLAHAGHPVVGDALYGGHRFKGIADPALRHAAEVLERQFLHACRLELRHPRTGERLVFESPLPPDLQHFLDDVAREAAQP